ncbi:hypothetical protein A9996_14835 [Gelidibacter algens]|nr:N-6 DNA methylase [Gelidibacter algens]OBX24547.1 hypothetical protein A9996_14835 [Gelidibacter algens]
MLLDAFYTLENENERLNKSFSAFKFEYDYNKKEDSEFIIQLFGAVSEFNFIENEPKFSDVIENLITHFVRYEGRKGVDTTTPQSISQLMIELLNPQKGSILDSTCGTGGFFQQISVNYPNRNLYFYGQEYNASTLAIAKLRFAFNEEDSIQFGEASNTLRDDQFGDLKADYVLMHPPFNLKLLSNDLRSYDPRFEFGLPPTRNANFAWIQHAIYHLNRTGKAVLLLSNSSLSAGGSEGQIRKNIIEADLVEAIIALPSQLLDNTSIPASIWVLNKNKPQKEKVLFIDASTLGHMVNKVQRALSNENILEIASNFWAIQQMDSSFIHKVGFSKLTSISEIADRGFLLTPGRYIDVEGLLDIDLSNTQELGSLLKDVKPSRIAPDKEYLKLMIKDLSSNPDSYQLNTENLSIGELNSNFRALENDVLLLARAGTNLKPTFYASSTKEIAYANMYEFKVDQSKVSIEYLVAELYKDYIKSQIESFNMGAAMPRIRREDLLKIRILVPSTIKEQTEIANKEREIRFQSLAKDLGFEKEIAKLKSAQMKDLGSKKHNIMQHLNNVKASADVLSKMMKLNNGILRSDEIIDPKRGVTVEKRLLRLQESLETVIYYVHNITNELKYDDAEILNIITLLKECKERGIQGEQFSVEIIVENQSFQGSEPLVNISKNDFEEIYINILENAINHGFVDENKSYIFRISIAFIDGYLEINFENNGKPFPKGIAERYYVKGEKGGTTAGTGIGLWKVSEIANHFDCKLEVFDEPTSEFPVGFKFKFNLKAR